MLETGTEDGGVSADDVARAFKLPQEREGGTLAGGAHVRAHDSVRTP